MKYKTYENLTYKKYNKGDYLLINIKLKDDIEQKKLSINGYLAGKVIDIQFEYDMWWYELILIDVTYVSVNNDHVVRKMTEKEIEEYNINKETYKYSI